MGVMQARTAGMAVPQALHDPHPRVVAEAAWACAALRETQAIPTRIRDPEAHTKAPELSPLTCCVW